MVEAIGSSVLNLLADGKWECTPEEVRYDGFPGIIAEILLEYCKKYCRNIVRILLSVEFIVLNE